MSLQDAIARLKETLIGLGVSNLCSAYRHWNAYDQAMIQVQVICRPEHWAEAKAWIEAEYDRQVELARQRPWVAPTIERISTRLARRLAKGEELAEAIAAEEADQAFRESEADLLLALGVAWTP